MQPSARWRTKILAFVMALGFGVSGVAAVDANADVIQYYDSYGFISSGLGRCVQPSSNTNGAGLIASSSGCYATPWRRQWHPDTNTYTLRWVPNGQDTGLCLDTWYGQTSLGTILVVGWCTGSATQTLAMDANAGGNYFLMRVVGANKCAYIAPQGFDWVRLANCVDDISERMKSVVPAHPATLTLASGECVQRPYVASVNDNAMAIAYPFDTSGCNGMLGHAWKLTPIGQGPFFLLQWAPQGMASGTCAQSLGIVDSPVYLVSCAATDASQWWAFGPSSGGHVTLRTSTGPMCIPSNRLVGVPDWRLLVTASCADPMLFTVTT